MPSGFQEPANFRIPMAAQPTAILCFDFDGTFVDEVPDWEAMQELLEVISQLRQAGAAWVINTGRSLVTLQDGMVLHGIQAQPDFIIAREGEMYALDEHGRYDAPAELGTWNKRMERSTRRALRQHLRFFRHLRSWMRDHTNAQWISDEAEPAGIVASSNEEMDEICAWMLGQAGEWPELCWQRASIYLRFSPPGFDKGTALRELGRICEVPSSHIFAIGDGHNDLSMLKPEVAGCLACPINSIFPVITQVHEAKGYRAEEASTRGCIEALGHYFFD